MTPQQEIARELCRRFPNTPSLTLAKKAYRTNPEVYSNLEGARAAVRRVRGVHGDQMADKSQYRAPRKAGERLFPAMPKGLTHFKDWQSFSVPGPAKALVLADAHIPYHRDDVLTLAVQYGIKRKVDTIVLNGDIADFFSCSFWEKDPRKRRFKDELHAVRSFLGLLRGTFPKARIIYKLGNHEERWERFMSVKAPELLDVEDFEFSKLMRLDDFGIDLVTDKRPILLGKLHIVHGHEFKFAIAGPVNPARGFFLKAKVHCLGGHFHHSSQHSEKNLSSHVVSTWSTGCLCDLHPDYAPINNWGHGFAIVEVDKAGTFHVDNLRIIDGRVY